MRHRDLAMAALTGLLVTMFALVVVGIFPAVVPEPAGALLAAFYVGVFVLVTAVVYRKRGRPDRETAGRSVWDAIPRWQYTGRHVESGGITRDGQERALEDVREQAEKRRDA